MESRWVVTFFVERSPSSPFSSSQISSLYKAVLPLSPLQGQITSSLDYVESQQKDLSDILDSYEAQVGELVDQSATSAGWRGNSGQAEKEREKA